MYDMKHSWQVVKRGRCVKWVCVRNVLLCPLCLLVVGWTDMEDLRFAEDVEIVVAGRRGFLRFGKGVKKPFNVACEGFLGVVVVV